MTTTAEGVETEQQREMSSVWLHEMQAICQPAGGCGNPEVACPEKEDPAA